MGVSQIDGFRSQQVSCGKELDSQSPEEKKKQPDKSSLKLKT